jgi:hypothetical protein
MENKKGSIECKFDKMYDRSSEEISELLKDQKKPLEKKKMKSILENNYREHQAAIIEEEFHIKEFDASLEVYDLKEKYNCHCRIKNLRDQMVFIATEYKEMFNEDIPTTE